MMIDLALKQTFERAPLQPKRRHVVPLDLLGWGLWCADIILINLIATLLGIDHHIMLVTLLLFPSLASLSGAYDPDSLFSMRRSIPRLARTWAASVLFTFSFQILLNSQIPIVPSRAIAWVFATLLSVIGARGAMTGFICRLRRSGRLNQRVAIYGATALGVNLRDHIDSRTSLTLDVVGFYDERSAARLKDQLAGLPYRGGLDALTADIRAGGVDQVIIALPWSEEIYVRKVISRLTLTPVRIRLLPDAALLAYPERPMVMLGGLPMMTLFERPISGLDAITKRIEDISLAVLLTFLATPILLITAIAIKLDSRGPIFFRQPREGFNNQQFRIWKFRSMYVGDGQTMAVRQATRNDPRITRVGRFIRATSIDELPQLFNVLSGEMSVVGPRPHAPSTRAGEKYFPDVIQTYAARHKVKPGITGWAQAHGWRGETDTEEKLVNRVNHDLYYIEHWSVWLDIYIILRTFFVLVGNRVY